MSVFDNAELTVQRMKNSFVYNLWPWSRVYIDIGLISLVSFIDWFGFK